MSASHPESPQRLAAINAAVKKAPWSEGVCFEEAPLLSLAGLATAHPQHYVDSIVEKSPAEGVVALDGDTLMNPHSLTAACRAAGAAIHATDEILAGTVSNAFCAVRPPGHHAESTIAMGFCFFNSIALAVERALAAGLERVAVLDFDVHHGNGTVEIFQDRPEVLVCSSFQYPFYPGRFDKVNKENICLTPLPAGTGSGQFRQAIERDWQEALGQHRPDMILVSAGFDAHRDDPLAQLQLDDLDYRWLGEQCASWAQRWSDGRLMAILEGGYNLPALARSSVQFISALVEE